MAEIDGVDGDEQLVDGMSLSVRLRYDFAVTDADRLLAAARRFYQQLNPDAGADEVDAMVSCAADALFVILEHADLFGAVVDNRLADYLSEGMQAGGFRAQVMVNEPRPLSVLPRGDCFRTDDVFALPTDAGSD